jgi:hypothetical protein
VLETALALRAAIWRLATLLPGDRALRGERSTAFAEGARTVGAIDPARVDAPVIPHWNVERAPDSLR